MSVAQDLLSREGRLLDERRWEEWLDLFAEDAIFWVPSWRDETSLCDDPARELSLIYMTSRAALADRVWRLNSNLSVASHPVIRTTHQRSDIEVEELAGGELLARSAYVVHTYNVKTERHHAFAGRSEHRLRHEAGHLKIAYRRSVLINDRIPTMLDFYMI